MDSYRLQSLESKLRSLKSGLSGYQAQLAEQKRRKSKVESIINSMKSICGGRPDDINSHLNTMISNYLEAMKGISSAATLASKTRIDREKDIYSDESMGEALANLNAELRDIDRKIDELESKIRSAESQISSCKTSIREEKRNLEQNV